jgi:nucleoside phosphorylase
MIISAGNEEVFEFATPIGVGLIESAMNLTRLCLFDKPDFLIFIGSAGSYGRLRPFEVIESFSAANIEHCFLQKRCYTPIDNIISIKPSILINSSNYITTDKTISKAYLSLGIDGENMEFYSVMRVAKEFGIGVIGIFVITNYCFEEAHKEYLQNIKKAKQTLTEYLMDKKLIKDKNG